MGPRKAPAYCSTDEVNIHFIQQPQPPHPRYDVPMRESDPETYGDQESNNDTMNDSALTHRPRRHRRWVYRRPQYLTPSQETIFYTMLIRKKQRSLNGTHQKSSKLHTVSMFSLLLLIYAVGAFKTSFQKGLQLTITVGLHEVIVIGGWMLLAVIVMNALAKSKFIIVLRWTIIFWPLVALVCSMFYPEGERRPWIALMFVVGEAATLVLFVGIYYVSPWALGSAWFRSKFRDTLVGDLVLLRGGKVRAVSRWTMSYRHFFLNSYTCLYEGETNPEGLPHGQGRWLDDSYTGEIYVGLFDDGKPVAPFLSREYGTGNTLSAVRIAYFMATDDTFTSHKINPSNDMSPRCGVASVECSIHGSFYQNLPEASKIYGPHVLGDVDDLGSLVSIRECCRRLIHLEEIGWSTFIGGANTTYDSYQRHVRVLGHTNETTSPPFSDGASQTITGAKLLDDNPSSHDESDDFMPLTRNVSWREAILGKDEKDHDKSRVLVLVDEPPSPLSPSDKSALDADSNDPFPDDDSAEHVFSRAEAQNLEQKKHSGWRNQHARRRSFTGSDHPKVRLGTHNFSSNKQKDALIYFPGFNQGLKAGLETLGQFVAMTKLSAHVFPIVYAWPGGIATPWSYHRASETVTSERNKEHFVSLLDGLRQSGVKNVHLMSHSMGVQPLLSVFESKIGGSRSEASLRFKLDPAFLSPDARKSLENKGGSEDDALSMRSITLINPDFPLDAFVDRAFLSVRQICSHVTVIGDRNDKALWWSELLGGLSKYFGYEQPRLLNGDKKEEKNSFGMQNILGREINKLYHPTPECGHDSTRIIDESNRTVDDDLFLEENIGDYEAYTKQMDADERLLFQSVLPEVPLRVPGFVHHQWLDIDVVDTTVLDTNMQKIRHSAFNINPTILKDLEELIVTGRRAAKRSALLHREGNIFSYCVAPRYVVM